MGQVSIGLPVYNGDDFIREAIESILSQTHGDLELLIGDNASTDGTEEICRDFERRDRRVRYIRRERNIGAVNNYNALVPIAKGAYFKWAAHDDVLAPTFLAESVNALERDPSVVLAMPRTMLIDEKGASLRYSPEQDGFVNDRGMCFPKAPDDNGAVTSSDPVERFAAIVFMTVLCAEIFGVMRRPLLDRMPLQGNYYGADKVFLADLSLRGRFWLGEEPLFLRRCHARQYSIIGVNSASYRAQWFRHGYLLSNQMLIQKLMVTHGYCRVVLASDLNTRQRLACFQMLADRSLVRLGSWLGFGNRRRLAAPRVDSEINPA